MDSYHQIPYEFGNHPVEKVMLNGKFLKNYKMKHFKPLTFNKAQKLLKNDKAK